MVVSLVQIVGRPCRTRIQHGASSVAFLGRHRRIPALDVDETDGLLQPGFWRPGAVCPLASPPAGIEVQVQALYAFLLVLARVTGVFVFLPLPVSEELSGSGAFGAFGGGDDFTVSALAAGAGR